MREEVKIPSAGEFVRGYLVFLMVALSTAASIVDTTWLEAYRQIDWKLLMFQVSLIVIQVSIGFLLFKRSPKIMGFSLMRLLGPIAGTKKTEPFSFWLWVIKMKGIGLLIGFIILTGLPRYARLEEMIFRQGTQGWPDAVLRSLLFGFMHMLIGVPVSAAIGLSFAGLFFSQMYFMGGIDLSSQAHFQHNLIIFTVLLGYVAYEALTRGREKEERLKEGEP